MSVRRLAVAAGLMLLAVYLKLMLPVFSEELLPALRRTLDEPQLVLYVPEEWLPWLTLR